MSDQQVRRYIFDPASGSLCEYHEPDGHHGCYGERVIHEGIYYEKAAYDDLTAKLEEYVHQSLLFDEQDKVKRLEGLVRALPNYEVVELHYQIVRCYRGTDDPTNFTFDSAKDAIAFYNLCCERQRME